MKKEKHYIFVVLGSILLLISVIFSIYTYRTSYQNSILVGEEISQLKSELSTLTNEAEKTNLSQWITNLSTEKLSYERPYSYSLTLLFFSILVFIKGLYNAFIGVKNEKIEVKRLAQAGLLAALCYIGFAFFKIDIPVGPEKTAFHFGNVFCVLAALLLGGLWAV